MPLELQSALQSTLPAQSVNQTSNGQTQAEATQVISSDFETFLRMLTTQLENQDPLNPIESQDFAVQLATFSGVEQQVQTNELLRNLNGSLEAHDLTQLANWIGMEALADAPVRFDGAPVDIVTTPAAGADSAEVVVRDALGVEMSREPVPLAGGTFSWVGRDANGDPLQDGTYTLELVSSFQGEIIDTQSVPHFSRVTEARIGQTGIELVTSAGSVVDAEGVQAIREPPS